MRLLSSSFRAHLFQTYFNLSAPETDAPFHVHGIDFCFRALVEGRVYPHIQASFNPSFRESLVRDTGFFEFDIVDPIQSLDVSQSDQVKQLATYLDNFADLTEIQKIRVGWVLSKMCFQPVTARLFDGAYQLSEPMTPLETSAAFLHCYSRYRMHVDDPAVPYSIDEFKAISERGADGIDRIDATYQVVVQSVKHAGDHETASAWQERHRTIIDEAMDALDPFTLTFVNSRYHRVGGFLPQMRQDSASMVAEMERAEALANELDRSTEVLRIAADEVLFPVIESRTKEALWNGDTELALSRIQRLTRISPNDSRVWLQLGEVHIERDEFEQALKAYRHAAELAPPGREIAWFMIGQCLEALDDLHQAGDAYLAALSLDPQAISAAEALVEVSKQLGQQTICSWATEHLNTLDAIKQRGVFKRQWAHQHIPRETGS
ncbi:tetratricopeptide repeat protein [Leisingera sp. ANG-Vp]|uniref:tetratricopeptide repeat protein n=1 Tax=Leisingera sp. ANG-Vp TaxID=1577896 RepID=UPI00057D0CDA|nr:tetratricopeptide repeat protein [Leisingera sp. ANG-Vp]KIC20121.1 hypothetical protein RA20_10425 [Leisingera sp. ANG-Vp]